MRVTYISGPISGYDYEERLRAFEKAADYIRDKGDRPVNPMENGLPRDAKTADHMRADFRLLLNCDSAYFLRGWAKSAGCKSEYMIAVDCGIEVMFEE